MIPFQSSRSVLQMSQGHEMQMYPVSDQLVAKPFMVTNNAFSTLTLDNYRQYAAHVQSWNEAIAAQFQHNEVPKSGTSRPSAPLMPMRPTLPAEVKSKFGGTVDPQTMMALMMVALAVMGAGDQIPKFLFMMYLW
jgi:hypothetical protein